MTLYEQNPAAWDALAAKGRKALAQMAKCIDTTQEMDAALGAINAAKHWHAGRNSASMAYENRARAWLDQAAAKVDNAPQVGRPSEAVYMVICPAAKSETVARVLRALACEVVEM